MNNLHKIILKEKYFNLLTLHLFDPRSFKNLNIPSCKIMSCLNHLGQSSFLCCPKVYPFKDQLFQSNETKDSIILQLKMDNRIR